MPRLTGLATGVYKSIAMLSWLCVLIPAQLGSLVIPLCNPASAVAPSILSSTAIDGTVLSPLSASSRWIVDSNGKRVKMRCVNWTGSLETNIPEGFSHRTPEDLASWIGNNGFNCVRLTYSIDMALSGDTPVEEAFSSAANSTGTGSNLTDIYTQAVKINPWLSGSTTLGAFAKTISSLGDKGIRVVLDNHVSKSAWCCTPIDGQGWWDQASGANDFSSKYFNTENWLAGLRVMSAFAKNHPNVVAMSLRNELRTFGLEDLDNHSDWFKFTQLGAQAIREENDDLIVVFGGPMSATDLDFLRLRQLDYAAWNGTGKTIYEAHIYPWSYLGLGDCGIFNLTMGERVGHVLEQNQAWTGPLWLSEFGVALTGGPNDGLSDSDNNYLTCLVEYMENNDADWAIWALQGSYYIRQGTVNYEESYGMLDKDWSDWRNKAFPAKLGSMFNVTQGP